MMCTVHVDAAYGALIAAGQRTLLASAHQSKIRQVLAHIHKVAVEKVRSSAMHDVSARSAIAELISKTKCLIWSERGFDSLDALERIYGPSRSGTSTFFGEWLSSRQQWQRAKNNSVNTEISSVFLADLEHITSYNAATSTISLSPAGLAPPLFYAHGTSAMLCGGLGYVYAAEMFRAVNALSYLLDGDTVAVPTDINNRHAFWSTFSCSPPDKADSLYPDLLALHVAYTAYMRFRDRTSDLPLKGLENYSPEQIFFITYCRSGCYASFGGDRANGVCADMSKTLPTFSAAFACGPYYKCRYFE